MGRRLKRGKAGNVAQYLTRTKAIRKLQLRLSEFRRLCILKGIHPREPKKKVHGANKTYYHIKDINWLLHEPLLQIFRNMKSHDRKIRKARAKFNPELAARLKQLTPTYKLDHLVKERYPSFVDALRDLDDALTMVHLFATLPAEKKLAIPGKAVQVAHQLALEWNAWVVRASALRKVFVSVKGIYFQAEVMGQAVTWLVPHQLAQVLPTDVDYRVMVTFLEFYECLLQFVNFKLYHTIGLKYPPVLDAQQLEKEALALAVVMRQLAGVRVEEGRAADAALAALKASDDTAAAAKAVAQEGKAAGGGKKELGREKVVARLQGLDAAQIAALAGVEAGARTGAEVQADSDDERALEIDSGDDEDSEVDSEAGEEESDEGEEEGEEGEDEGDETEEEGGEEGSMMQLEERRATGALAGPRGEDDDDEQVAGGALGQGVAADDEAAVCGALFRGLVFFLAREVPREPLALVIRAFGGMAAWDGEGSPYEMSDERITHQVVDRPTQGHKFLSRHYLQPQWVFDCANFRVLLPTAVYAPGKAPPPHLSPFVNDEEEGYTPDWALEVRKLQEAAKAARVRASGLMVEGFAEEAAQGENNDDANTTAIIAATDDDVLAAEIAHQQDLTRELRAATGKRSRSDGEDLQGDGLASGSGEGDEGDEDEEDEEDDGSEDGENDGTDGALATLRRQGKAAARTAAQDEADQGLLKDVMMTRKNRKLYERINRAREGKRQRIEVLHDRKAALEKQQQGAKQQAPGKQQTGKRK